MKKISTRLLTIATAFVVVCSFSAPALAQEALYKSKCAMCHGVDGKKLTGHDLSGADTQAKSDADISGIITNGKGKMPPYKSLKPEEVSGLVAYIRTLKK